MHSLQIMLRWTCVSLVALTLAACASTPQEPSTDSFQRVAGKRIYGWVVVTSTEGPEDAVARSSVCDKRDAACLLMLQEAHKFHYAAVAVYGTFMFQKVLVPREAALRYTDIIQIEVPGDPRALPMFVSLGARAMDRGPHCNWMDGSDLARRGGVVCAGWTYKSLR